MKTNAESETQWPGGSPVLAAVVGLTGMLLGGLGVFLWQVDRSGKTDSPPESATEIATSPVVSEPSAEVAAHIPAAELSPVLARGRELSLTYCAACHLYPEPGTLDRFTWAMETLPRMSYWLGLAKNDLTGEPGIEDLVKAGLLPTVPLLTVEDWKAICNYYIAMAPDVPVEITSRPRTPVDLRQFEPRVIPSKGPALNTMVRIVPGKRQLMLGNGRSNTVDLITLEGALLRSERVASLAVDANPVAGGWLLSLIGSLPPADDATGSLVFLPESGGPARPVLEGLRRPVQTLVHDMDGDGRLDRVVNEYGNIAGGLSWQRDLGSGKFESTSLLDQPGGARSAIADFNGDGKPDIAVILAQARESVTILLNEGKGVFAPNSVADYHPAWGNVHLDVADFDGDGRADLLTVNGDSADYMEYPAPRRAYHGVRILLNKGTDDEGRLHFHEAYFFPMYGAYKAFARDFDEDGDLDIAACAYYPHFPTRPEDGFVYLENRGKFEFAASTRSEGLSGRWISMDAADADGDGDIDLVLGSFVDGPGDVPQKLSQEWDIRGAAVLYLENQLR